MSKITQSAISLKPTDQNKKKKKEFWRIYFHTSMFVLGLKIQNTNGQKSLCKFLDICKIDI